ncbi:MAG: FprA family A-type flavoprotein, partial [Muribaculum sp.]|nr:FprA family A-type flavoprotein [Muribaculum sp.]
MGNDRFPKCIMVATAVAAKMLPQLCDNAYEDRMQIVSDNDTLELGHHTLTFVTAPMVHWPEVMMTYDTATGTLFSADGFGRFGNPDPTLPWACEARRYYFNIVGKYGAQVQKALSKFEGKEISVIAPLHGPVLEGDLSEYLQLYNTWSRYEVETPGVFIAYGSMHGLTKQAALHLAEILKANGGAKVSLADITRDDMAEAIEDAKLNSEVNGIHNTEFYAG